MSLLVFANILSVLPLIIIAYNIFKSFILFLFNNNITQLIYVIGLLVSSIVPQLIKKIPWAESTYHITMRPNGAKDTNYLSNNGLCANNTPGFPSGHMSTTSYFCIYNILFIINQTKLFNKLQKILLICTNLIIIFLMGWARIYKKCHTFIQVCAGIILGTIIAIIFNKIIGNLN